MIKHSEDTQNATCDNNVLAVRSCLKCGCYLYNKRKKYCSEMCKWLFNSIKKDNEKHLPPSKKGNENYFHMVIGFERAKSQSRQGKRIGNMVTGSMAAMVNVTIEKIVELNEENLIKHFKGLQFYKPNYIRLGNMELLNKKEIFERFGIFLE